jgi:hypothetical protein
MDFLTHSLVGAGTARLVTARREWPRRIETRWTAGYAALVLVYLAAQAMVGQPTYI